MKLYQLSRDSRFTIVGDESKTKYLLDHIDGMYSYCYRCFDDEVYHISAFTEVEEVDV
jgi:hypothetical protein